MKVWIDQDLCTGDGLCEEICPRVFTMQQDGLAYVQDENGIRKGHDTVDVPEGLEDAVQEAAEECPGECIFIESD